MRVFILCTGRSGSLTFIRACKHITNYTAGHESRAREVGDDRFTYPDGHIEADNRLIWFAGTLDHLYGNEAFYVHLIRDKEATVSSYNLRWTRYGSLIKAYCEGILQITLHRLNDEKRAEVVADFYDRVNLNITHFLKDKEHKMTFHLEQAQEEFPEFWKRIGAEGQLEKAVKVFREQHNRSKTRRLKQTRHELRFRLMQWKRRLS
ncbi:MAG: hypothetical protein ACWGNV_03475 [Bacteroidales bacterium]